VRRTLSRRRFPVAATTAPAYVKNFTNFSCTRPSQLLNNALYFAVRLATLNRLQFEFLLRSDISEVDK
jgi:hypothetical protein